MLGPSVVIFSGDLTRRSSLEKAILALRDELQNLTVTTYDIKSASNLPEPDAAIVVVDLDLWSVTDESLIASLRGTGFRGSILVICKRDTGFQQPKGRLFDKLFFFDKPYNPKELFGIARRLILAPIVAARQHARHETNEQAELTVDGPPMATYVCHVKNMSKGGAFLFFQRPIHVRVGNVVVLKVRLGQMKRQYEIRARIAWIDKARTGLGIEFNAEM